MPGAHAGDLSTLSRSLYQSDDGRPECQDGEGRFAPIYLISRSPGLTITPGSGCADVKPLRDAAPVYNIVKVPDGGPEWVSIGISVMALLASVGIPGYQFWRQRKSSVNEGYWLREVIFPRINDTLFSVIKKFKESVDATPVDFPGVYGDTLIPAMNELRDAANLMNTFPGNQVFIDRMEALCDSLEDEVVNNQSLSRALRLYDISQFHNKTIALLIEYHFKNL